jgi:DnaK suppressor protein
LQATGVGQNEEREMTAMQRTIRLRRILESYRGQLLGEIAESMRHVRDQSRALHASDVLNRAERVQVEGLDYALLWLKAGTVRRVDEALRLLDADAYGLCAECGQEISDQRLLAMPFAIRCRDCEELAEVTSPWQTPRRGRVRFDEQGL